MKLAAISTCKNEADIVGATLAHLFSQGVERVYIADGMSTDGTRDILADHRVTLFDDDSPIHRQPYWMSRLAQLAYEEGADWVIPFDADEFVCGIEHLAQVPDSIGKVTVPMYHYVDFDYRNPDWKPLRKVAFRAANGIQVANGSHDATGTIGATTGSSLIIREVQYRGFEHFCRKIVERNATLDPSLPPGEGTHHSQYAGWSKEQLEPVWQAMVDRATVLDPIPVRHS